MGSRLVGLGKDVTTEVVSLTSLTATSAEVCADWSGIHLATFKVLVGLLGD